MKRILKYLSVVLFVLLGAAFVVAPSLLDRSANRVLEGTMATTVSDSAGQLHEKLWIADLHCDALLWNRDLLQRNSYGHVDLPRMLEGNFALQAFTIVSKTPYGLNFEQNDDSSDMITLAAVLQRWPVRTWFSLKERALYQAEKLSRFVEKSSGKLALITTRSGLVEFNARRRNNPNLTAAFLGIEGAQVLEGDLTNVSVLFNAGFRMMAPTHFFDNEVGGSAHGVIKGGLTDFGHRVVQEMERLGMIVDLAHASPQTVDDVLAMATRPVFVSHTGVKGTCDNVRNLSDKHLLEIAATGGVVGIAFFSQATCGSDIAAIVKAIRYAVELVGVGHVALGSDFDGAVQTPFDAAGMVSLTEALLSDGFTAEEIVLIMGGNVRRVLLQVLPDAA